MVTKKILSYFSSLKGKASQGAGKTRQHPRLRAFNLIKFTTSDGTRYESISNIVDISEHGLQFSCYEKLATGQDLTMMVNIPHANKEIKLKARLVWVRKANSPRGVFIAGVQFNHISDDDRRLIREMLEGAGKRTQRKS